MIIDMDMLNGVGVALITPFNDDLTVDYGSLSSLIDYIESGVDYFVALGTTAETATLSVEEQRKVTDFIIEKVAGRKPIVIGIGGNSTSDVVSKIKSFNFDGISALLSVTPYYNKPSQEGLFQHYKAVTEASPVPVILYNVPGRTGVNMLAETTIRIAKECKNAVAIKDATASISQISKIVAGVPEGFKVLSGDDNFAPTLISLGGHGVISVAANCFPSTFREMIYSSINEDMKSMRSCYYRLFEATDMLFAEGNPAGAKAALSIKGLIKNNLRLPLTPASEALIEKMKAKIEEKSI